MAPIRDRHHEAARSLWHAPAATFSASTRSFDDSDRRRHREVGTSPHASPARKWCSRSRHDARSITGTCPVARRCGSCFMQVHCSPVSPCRSRDGKTGHASRCLASVRPSSRTSRVGHRNTFDYRAETRQMVLPTSSATKSPPRVSSATPTGRPIASPSAPRKPVSTFVGKPDGRPALKGT